MPSRVSKDDNNDYSFPPCKDTLSSKIIMVIAIFWLALGVFFLIAPFIVPGIRTVLSTINNSYPYPNQVRVNIQTGVIVICICAAVGCFILSAFFFLLFNIACDIHRTEHHLRELIYNSQNNKNEILQQIRYVDDSVTRQSKVLIHQMNKQKPKEEGRSAFGSANAHDGAF